MRAPVYLDYNAGAPIRPEARAAAVCALDIGGNPSSVHATGRLARAAVERAREQVAALVGAAPDQLTFTSGGTEANALAIHAAIASGARRPIVLATEHDSVMATATATGLWVEAWPVNGRGVADLDWLRDRLHAWPREDGAPFVALALANHETGVIQPVVQAAALAHEAGGRLHVDAVQGAGKIEVDFGGLGADTMALSGHKLGGPQGVGALVAGPRAELRRLQFGGGQERGLRAGTENVPGIAGFGAAAGAVMSDLAHVRHPEEARRAVSKDALELPCVVRDALRAPHHDERWNNGAEEASARLASAGAVIAGEGAPRLPGVLCTAVEGWASALQVMALDLEGVRVSAGAACSSGKVRASGVLTAMGFGALADGALRASGGWATTAEDWDRFADVWLEAYARHTARRRVKEYA